MHQRLARPQFQSGLISVLIPIALLYGASHQSWREALLKLAPPSHTHLDEHGALQLKNEASTRLPITANDLAGIAEQLSDLLDLIENTLMACAGCSARDATTHLLAYYAFNGELWVEPGAYYVGHTFENAERVRRQAEQASGHRRVAMLRQADLFISKVRRVSLSDLRFIPRDAIIPDVVLEHWVNHYLNSRQEGQPLFVVRQQNGAVRFRLRDGAGENGLRVRH